ncbi:MAG: type II toxin-antitoxin system RelE/ParE family toxin [Bacteroidales bacterium]|nr:type II toxin-antitoxin system RelE/ParE family toxin [Bacteroidales bacterium]
MVDYVLSDRAKKDLIDIWQYTFNRWSRNQADFYTRKLLDACAFISTAPELVGISYEYVLSGYKAFLVGKHLIFYKMLNGKVFIVRILHQRMDVERNL